jgi:hypothetical protein
MGVSVFRIEYEMVPSLNPWIAFIAAFTHEEAHKHLSNVVNKPIRITASGLACRLDDLSTEVRQNVIDAFVNKEGKKVNKIDSIEKNKKVIYK